MRIIGNGHGPRKAFYRVKKRFTGPWKFNIKIDRILVESSDIRLIVDRKISLDRS